MCSAKTYDLSRLMANAMRSYQIVPRGARERRRRENEACAHATFQPLPTIGRARRSGTASARRAATAPTAVVVGYVERGSAAHGEERDSAGMGTFVPARGLPGSWSAH